MKPTPQTIAAASILLACVDALALATLDLELWEALSIGALLITSYALGLRVGLSNDTEL
jgi:hypothetical protein